MSRFLHIYENICLHHSKIHFRVDFKYSSLLRSASTILSKYKKWNVMQNSLLRDLRQLTQELIANISDSILHLLIVCCICIHFKSLYYCFFILFCYLEWMEPSFLFCLCTLLEIKLWNIFGGWLRLMFF